jgi:LacI family transcriptional regulator
VEIIIVNGNGKKRLTTIEIAQLAKTSKSTVSRVLMGSSHVAPETRKRIEDVIKQSNYHPNLFARGLRGGGTGQIGVIGRWMEPGFFADVIKGLDEEASRQDLHLLTSQAHSAEDYIRLWRNFSAGRQVDGLILVAPPLKLFDEPFGPEEIPIVLCASQPPARSNGWANVDSVVLDNVTAMKTLVDSLVEAGCRHLMHIAGTADTFDARDRLLAFQTAVARHEGVKGEILRGATWRTTAKTRVLEYLDTHDRCPDAFMAFNDMLAIGALEALKERGLVVPRDVAVTGFDDVAMSEFIGLTTVRVPGVLIGNECGRLLRQAIDQETASPVARNALYRLEIQHRVSSLFKQNYCVTWGGMPLPK